MPDSTAEAASKIRWFLVVSQTRFRPRRDRFAPTPDKSRHDLRMTQREGPELRPRANPNDRRLRFYDALVNSWWAHRDLALYIVDKDEYQVVNFGPTSTASTESASARKPRKCRSYTTALRLFCATALRGRARQPLFG